MGAFKGLSTGAVVLVLGLALLVVLLVLGLVFLAGPEGQQDMLRWISSIGALLSSSLSALALAYGRRTSRQGKETADAVATVQHQTNGALDARMQKAIEQALAAQAAKEK